MALTGKQRAAMLLMSLDAATAAELLKGVDAKVVQELAVELSHLDAVGYRNSKQSLEFTRQFCNSLRAGGEFHLKNFLKELLKSIVGDEKAGHIQTRIRGLLQKRDLFTPVRSADTQMIASLLEDEHPQAAAVVLSELPTKKASEVLGLLGEGIQVSAISRMNSCERVTAESKARIAKTVCRRLKAVTRESQAREIAIEESPTSNTSEALSTQPAQKSSRERTVTLRNLGKRIRGGLLGVIRGKDNRADEMAADLMIAWEGIPQIADSSLKEALRRIGPGKLALALAGADYTLTQKIMSNISEQASAALDEEVSVVSSPRKEDVEQARDAIVQVLRKMNEEGELGFIEE